MKRGRLLLRGLWRFWISVCAALVIIVLLEGVVRVAPSVYRHAVPREGVLDFAEVLRAGAMGKADWVGDYIREYTAIRTQWHPYVYWRVASRRGTLINVNEAGVRHTWNATASPAPGQLKVFALGGSGMWGVGARDDFTIPSLVSKKLVARAPAGVWVTNLSQLGWVSTQGVVALMLELRKRNIPDIVVFNEGMNDLYSAFQHGVAGQTLNESNRAREFNLLSEGSLFPIMLRRLALYKLAERAASRIRGSPTVTRPGDEPAGAEPLARAVLDVYFGNVELVESLAGRYGFKAYFFWQPTLFTKKRLSEHEKWEMSQSRNTQAAPYVFQTHKILDERLRTGRLPGVYNLADIFGDDDRTMFLDSVHPLETGNDAAASAIVEVVRSAGALAKR